MKDEIKSEDKRKEYLTELSFGHAILTEAYAKEICSAFNVQYDKKLSMKQYDSKHGVFDNEGNLKQGLKGVNDLDLLYYLAKMLNVNASNSFMGLGFQAQFVAEEIKKSLKLDNDSK